MIKLTGTKGRRKKNLEEYMCVRDRDAFLNPCEIEAIKAIQEIIRRMADSSARVKTAFAALVGASGVLLGGGLVKARWIVLAGFLLMVCILWWMDISYLRLERQYRMHHSAILDGKVNYLDQWDFNPNRYSVSVWSVISSFSVLIYPAFIVVCLVFYLVR